IAFQVPVAWLADRLGRTNVLLGCYGVAALGLIVGPFCVNPWSLTPWLFLVGACSGAFYPLRLATLGERTRPAAVARASAWNLAINCVGSRLGPTCTGQIMDRFGPRAMFIAGELAVVGVVAAWGGLKLYERLKPSRPVQPVVEPAVAKKLAA